MKIYAFKDEPLRIANAKDADPQAIGEELEQLTDPERGLSARLALEKARAETSALHRHLTWDDREAAEAHRLDQVREIIRSIVVVEPQQVGEPARAFLSINQSGTAYHPVGEVMNSQRLQLAVMQQAERDLEAWEKRYRELADICAAVRLARERLRRRRDALAGAPPTA